MRSTSVLAISALGALGLGGCVDLGVHLPDSGVGGAVDGVVEDVSGKALSGVRVSGILGSTTSDGNGKFHLSALADYADTVSFSRAGYVSATRNVAAVGSGTWLPMVMTAEASAQPFDATAGGTVNAARNARLIVGPGALVDESGAAVTGAVQIALTPLDPSLPAELAAYPGDLVGLDSDGEAILQTYGVLDIEVRQNGRSLQLAPGATAELRVPAASSGDHPASARFWTLDETTGIWMEQTTASYQAASNTYVATVTHFSKCNIDEPIDPACLRGIIQDKNGRPSGGAMVRFDGVDYPGRSQDYTDGDGSFCMTVKMSSTVHLTAERNGVTAERTVQTGNTRNTYPPSCSLARCHDLGSITLGEPAPTGDGGTPAIDCSSLSGGGAKDPFWGTCAAGLSAMFSCFRPSGECHYTIDLFGGGDFTVTYGNGAKIVFTVSAITGEAEGQLYGPGGISCGTMDTSDAGLTMTPATGGGSYSFESTPKGGTIIECPSGATVTLDGAQRDAMEACSGSSAGVDTGNPGSSACTPEPGSMGGSCKGAGCSTGLTCCTRYGGNGLCLDESECEAYQTYGCTSDATCGDVTRCCSAGYFKMCMDVPSCY